MLRRLMMAVTSGSTPITDDFSTNTIASYTEYADTTGAWAISSGVIAPTNGGVAQSILTRNGFSAADAEVSCVITQAHDAGLALRLLDNNNYYVAVIYDGSAGTPNLVRIYKRVSGTFTEIGTAQSIATFTRGTPHTLSFSAVGSALVIKFDGVTVKSETDSALTAAGKVGLRATASTTNTFSSITWVPIP